MKHVKYLRDNIENRQNSITKGCRFSRSMIETHYNNLALQILKLMFLVHSNIEIVNESVNYKNALKAK